MNENLLVANNCYVVRMCDGDNACGYNVLLTFLIMLLKMFTFVYLLPFFFNF